jgi:hypothetical protein
MVGLFSSRRTTEGRQDRLSSVNLAWWRLRLVRVVRGKERDGRKDTEWGEKIIKGINHFSLISGMTGNFYVFVRQEAVKSGAIADSYLRY